jgi:hypothetical protein
VQVRTAGAWQTHVIDASVRAFALGGEGNAAAHPDLVAVTALDRTEQAGSVSALRLP